MSDEFAEPELLDPFSAAEIAAQSVLEQERLAWALHERISRIFKILQLLQDLLHFYAVIRSVDSTRFDLGAKVGRSTACVEQEVSNLFLVCTRFQRQRLLTGSSRRRQITVWQLHRAQVLLFCSKCCMWGLLRPEDFVGATKEVCSTEVCSHNLEHWFQIEIRI